jgi:hydrogenase-4 component B
MDLLLAAIATLGAGGALAILFSRSARAATLLGAGSAVLGCILGFGGALGALTGGRESLRWNWDVPYGSFYLELDALSAFFLLPVFGLCALAALYGGEYLQVAFL